MGYENIASLGRLGSFENELGGMFDMVSSAGANVNASVAAAAQPTEQQLLQQQLAAEKQAHAGTSKQLASNQAMGTALTGIGQIVGAIGGVGAQFFQAHQQAKLQKAMMKMQQNQPQQFAPQQVFIPPPPPSKLPLILGGLAVVGAIGFVIYSQNKDDGYGGGYAPPAQGPVTAVVGGQPVSQPYYPTPPPPRRRVIRRRRKKKPKK